MGDLLVAIPWGIVLVVLPLAAAMIAFLWPGVARSLALLCSLAMAVAVLGFALQLNLHGPFRHALGGWDAPLGIALYGDGLSLLMLTATALVGLAVSVYAAAYFSGQKERHFWPLWLFLLAALNALFLSGDIFNLYVTLELLGLAAVSLTALNGGRAALVGAMRYLLVSLFGSLAYLLGVALLYHAFGTVDIATLSARMAPVPAAWTALGLMATGLILKTALFPLHFWLPPAHSSAPSPVSAVLSALVIKASFYILLRLWLTVFGQLGADMVATLLGWLGAAAVLWGSLQAMRQTRLKLLVAYSTVAQIGYLFLAFPLAAATQTAWAGAAYLMLSHALAKAAMFMAAGNLLRFGGHDRIADLDRLVQRLPVSAFAFTLAGVSLMGLPPSGGFIGKWLLLEAALAQGRWDLAMVMLIGGLFAAAYVFKVLGKCFTQADMTHEPMAVPAPMEWAAFSLACAAILLGFLAMPALSLLEIGAPFGNGGGP